MKLVSYNLCILIVALLHVGCYTKQTKMSFKDLEIEKLNLKTLNYIDTKCQVSLNDSLETPLSLNGSEIYTYHQYFRYHLDKREKLFYYLDSMNITFRNEFDLFENYAIDVNYLLLVDNNRQFSFQISNGGGLVNFEEQVKNYFNQIDSSFCAFSSIGYGRFMLWNKFKNSSDSIETISLNNY